MLQDIRELTSLEMNHVFGGHITEEVASVEAPPKKDDSGAGVSSFSNADAFAAGALFLGVAAIGAATAPFIAVGVVAWGVGVSAGVLAASGSALIGFAFSG
jgi:hypothetical protein